MYVTLGIVPQRDVLEGRRPPSMCLVEMKEKLMVEEVVCTSATEKVTWNETFEL